MAILLMAKNIPVLKIQDGKCEVLCPELLPYSIRKETVSVEDFYGNWINGRAIQLSRTNSKMILNSIRVSQSNAFAICKACYGLSFSDMYWFKNEEDDILWEDINLFENEISRGMAATALVGDVLREKGKLHTPELTTQGMTAKAWVKDSGDIFLYKIGRKELAASKILDALGFDHVKYEEVVNGELEKVVTPMRKAQIDALGEKVVKCKLLTSEEYSMVNFEDYQIYCENHGKNVYQETLDLDKKRYLEMQVADYILNNVDRHTANWGYLMDNQTGKLLCLYPLLDHDHAFSDVEGMSSQTTEERMDLYTAALLAQSELQCDLSQVHCLGCPDGLREDEWQAVVRRTEELEQSSRIYCDVLNTGYQPTWTMIENIQKIERLRGEKVSFLNIIEKYNIGNVLCEEELVVIEEVKNQ